MHTPGTVDIRSLPPPPEWGVVVDGEAADRLANRWRDRSFPPPAFDYQGLPALRGDDWLNFCVLAVSVIACLWPPEGAETWTVELEGDRLDDAPGVFACFTRVGERAADPVWFAGWDDADAERFFDGRGTLQLIPERGARLRSVARMLLDRWGGSARALLESAGWDGPAAVEQLVASIPGYRDRVDTDLGQLRFDKLAHLAVAMMSTRSPEPIGRLETFPVYPDYMLPRILRHHGVLRYSADLADAVDSRRLIPEHSEWELAIRWGTVYAAATLRQALAGRGNPVSSPALDYHLWWSAVLGPDAGEMGEHHRTVTLAY